MKAVIGLIILNIVVVVIAIVSRFWEYSENKFISEEVLEMSTPFDVTIDTEFLENLKPAYEQ
ncbi:hypothetical protein JXA34_03830 [Patescibacteria group bacterium]|nr:hypothetical protein [Patescibacteria group bacterium]